MQEAENE